MRAMTVAATATLVMATRRNGSLILLATAASDALTAAPAPAPRVFFPAPGSRLISIMAVVPRVGVGSLSDLAQGEADRKHEQRSDLVGDERLEGTVTHLQVRQWVGLLDGDAQSCRQRLGESRDSRAAAGRVHAPDLRRGAGRGGQEGGRTLDADGDLLAARLEHGVQVRGAVVPLEQRVGLLGAQPAVALEILAQTSRAKCDIAREDRHTFVEDVDVGHLVPD